MQLNKSGSLSKIISENNIERKLRGSAESEIRDLSGGRHKINSSIKLSKAS